MRERPFPEVVRRVGAFFGDSRREIDVLSAHVFGVGLGMLRTRISPPLR